MVEGGEEIVAGAKFGVQFVGQRPFLTQAIENKRGGAVVFVIGHVIAKLQVACRKVNIEQTAGAVFDVDVIAPSNPGPLLFEGEAHL